MNTLVWKKSDSFLTLNSDTRINCWSKVRNEINGLRPRKPLLAGTTDVYRATDGIPAMPRPFPIGSWHIVGFNEHPDPNEDHGYLYPVFIATDAVSQVPEWQLDDDGLYMKPTGRLVADSDLGLHFSTSDWTQGCLRIEKQDDILALWHTLKSGDSLIVTS